MDENEIAKVIFDAYGDLDLDDVTGAFMPGGERWTVARAIAASLTKAGMRLKREKVE